MKIGIVSEFHYPTIGGIQDNLHHFHRELVRLGYDSVVITSRVLDTDFPPGEAVRDPGRVVRIGRSRVFPANGSASRITTGLHLADEFKRVLDRERCDLLHVHTPFVPTLPLLALKYADVPVVGVFHTNLKPDTDRFIKKFLPLMGQYMNRLDARIAVSETSARAMEQLFGGTYHVVPNAVDVRGFQAAEPMPGLRGGPCNVLFVGRLDPRNGLDALIAATAKAARKVPIRLLVMGDGPHRPRYEALARRSLGEKALFLGTRIATRPRWYAGADVLCAPMHVASFGIVLIEGMAAGLPIVANRIAGFSDVMEHGRQGVFVDIEDTNEFADALVELASDPLRRRRLGQAGLESVRRYAWERVIGETIDVWRGVLGLAPGLNRRAS